MNVVLVGCKLITVESMYSNNDVKSFEDPFVILYLIHIFNQKLRIKILIHHIIDVEGIFIYITCTKHKTLDWP